MVCPSAGWALVKIPWKTTKADVLRKYAIFSVISVLILGGIGAVSAFQQMWALSLVLGYCCLLLLVIILLLSTRYVVRLLRTIENKSIVNNDRLVDRITREMQAGQRKDQQALAEQQMLLTKQAKTLEAGEKNISDQTKSITALETKLHSTVGTIVRHMSSTIRHSTSEVEALIQIYSRYSDLKLPMPATGGWALDAQSLAHLISLVEEYRPRRILELGSGTSTIWLGHLCRLYGGQVVTLDHLQGFLDKTRAEVDKHALNAQVELRLAPLREISCDGEQYEWYNLEALEDLSDIDMVLVDGPPEKTGPNARYPALPQTRSLLSPSAMIILDDAHRPDETNTIDLWCSRYPEFSILPISASRLAVLSRQA